MRIWDVDPGYLARQQLLGEHRELHGLFNVLTMDKKGYASHPETKRWVGCIDALICRHDLLVSEMQMRGYNHHSPLSERQGDLVWPSLYIDSPARQLELLAGKYASDARSGRIPLPKNSQQLWAQYKYSVMAHAPQLYREIGPEVAHGSYRNDMGALALQLVETVRKAPEPGHLFNAIQHMWGYAKESGSPPSGTAELLSAVQVAATEEDKRYLIHSTALCELAIWI